MEASKHFKMYKRGKNWCVMAIAIVATLIGISVSANADSVTTSSVLDNTQVSQSVENNETVSDNSSTKDNSVATISANTVSKNASSVVNNGWVKNNNTWTYYTNGEVIQGRNYSYLPSINGQGSNWYLIDNGVAQSGVQQWAGTYYDFDPSTYLKVTNDYVQSQWGDWYMFGNDGRIATKVYQWAGTYYYFDPTTYLRVDNDYRQSQWGDWYMFGNDGRIATKVYKWADTYYYFDPTTYLRVDNDYRQSQWGDWYMFGNDGRIISGIKQWYGSLYYFDPVTYLKATNRTINIGGMSLYADASGKLSGTNAQSRFLLSIYQAAKDGWSTYGVLPSVTAAQAILESAWGQSGLATKGHNLFGIKGNYNGQSIVMRTAEYGSNGYYYINDAFRKYPSNYESVVDHGRFLASNSRYNNLLWDKNYKDVTKKLQSDGYATAPTYSSSLNHVIETYNLTSWDN